MGSLKLRQRCMVTCLVGALCMTLLTSSCSCSSNDDNAILNGTLSYQQDELKVKPFTKIEVETMADVYYVQNDTTQHRVDFDFSKIKDASMREQFKKNAIAVYRDGKVIIGLKGKVSGATKLNQGQRLCVYITSPDLVKVTLEGVGLFHADAINSDVFEIDNEGVGNVNVKKMLVNKVSIDNEGVGNVKVNDLQADRVDINNEGVGSVNVGRFKGGKMEIDNEGVGKVQANVDCQSIYANLDGVGSIQLSGVTRHLNKEKNGVGSIKISELKVLGK